MNDFDERNIKIQRLEEKISRMEAALKSDAQTLRLHMGELSAQELRSLRAAFDWVLYKSLDKRELEYDN